MKKLIYFSIILLSLANCQSIRWTSGKAEINKLLDKDHLGRHFTGFALFDPESLTWIIEKNPDKYFTPASNVKLLSLFAGIKILGDSLPGIIYQRSGDSLFIRGTGDPTFLHPDFKDQKIYDFLSEHNGPVIFVPNLLSSKPYGPGWSWDDYQFDFQPERSDLPLYGNVVRLENYNGMTTVKPQVFSDAVIQRGDISSETRFIDHNIFIVSGDYEADKEIPFRVYPELIASLLSDTLQKKVLIQEKSFGGIKKYSQKSDLLYSIMMKRSDNFFAEQLLIMCSSVFSDTLSVEKTIGHVKRNYLANLPDPAIWVDGSGLSRYNLITPRSLVMLLRMLRQERSDQWLFSIFPAGGQSGTIKDWYAGISTPYVFAKTGTLSNNHNLSGYLLTRSGKILIFSFMNNNYTYPVDIVKNEMEKVLEIVRDKY